MYDQLGLFPYPTTPTPPFPQSINLYESLTPSHSLINILLSYVVFYTTSCSISIPHTSHRPPHTSLTPSHTSFISGRTTRVPLSSRYLIPHKLSQIDHSQSPYYLIIPSNYLIIISYLPHTVSLTLPHTSLTFPHVSLCSVIASPDPSLTHSPLWP